MRVWSVELTVVLHYVFNTPKDKLVDVINVTHIKLLLVEEKKLKHFEKAEVSQDLPNERKVNMIHLEQLIVLLLFLQHLGWQLQKNYQTTIIM